MNPVTRFLLSLCILLLAAMPAGAANRVSLAAPDAIQDGTPFVVTFSAPELDKLTVTFRGKTLEVPSETAPEGGKRARLVLAMPLDAKAGSVPLTWKAAGGTGATAWTESGSRSLSLTRRQYPEQKLTLPPKYVTPDPSLKERIERERAIMTRAQNTYSVERKWNLPLARPVPGSLSSGYGLRRTLNGETKSRHRGLDFRGGMGQPVRSCEDGTVVLTGEFYYAGNCVIVDHGLGVLTIYMHLSEIDVNQGDLVTRGQVVGKIGSTGRSTGPHLHLGLTVLGQSVDPGPLLEARPVDQSPRAPKAGNTASPKSAAKKGSTTK